MEKYQTEAGVMGKKWGNRLKGWLHYFGFEKCHLASSTINSAHIETQSEDEPISSYTN